jgi:hypothetical protein
MNEFLTQLSSSIVTFQYILLIVNIIIHLLFAGAVAKDAGKINQLGHRTALVSPSTWAFATLLGGVIIAAIYWFIHHSTLTRPTSGEKSYERS